MTATSDDEMDYSRYFPASETNALFLLPPSPRQLKRRDVTRFALFSLFLLSPSRRETAETEVTYTVQ